MENTEKSPGNPHKKTPVKKTAPKKTPAVKAPPPLNIHQRIREVKRMVNLVRKTAEVKTGGDTYMAVSHDEVTKVLHDPMVDQGINTMCSVIQESIETLEVGRSRSGAMKMRLMSVWGISFVNVDDPSDMVNFVIPVHADDFSDKAPGKACSMAVKIAMLKCFGLESGDNEEARLSDEGDGARRITPEEAAKLRELIEKSPGTEEQFLAYLHQDKTMKSVTTLEDMHLGVWEWAMTFVQGEIDKAGNGQSGSQ